MTQTIRLAHSTKNVTVPLRNDPIGMAGVFDLLRIKLEAFATQVCGTVLDEGMFVAIGLPIERRTEIFGETYQLYPITLFANIAQEN